MKMISSTRRPLSIWFFTVVCISHSNSTHPAGVSHYVYTMWILYFSPSPCQACQKYIFPSSSSSPRHSRLSMQVNRHNATLMTTTALHANVQRSLATNLSKCHMQCILHTSFQPYLPQSLPLKPRNWNLLRNSLQTVPFKVMVLALRVVRPRSIC